MIITDCALGCNITTPTLAIFRTLPVVAPITNEEKKSGKESIHELKCERILKKPLRNHGLRRLGVPGLELNAEPILYGVDVPLLILGSLDSPK